MMPLGRRERTRRESISQRARARRKRRRFAPLADACANNARGSLTRRDPRALAATRRGSREPLSIADLSPEAHASPKYIVTQCQRGSREPILIAEQCPRGSREPVLIAEQCPRGSREPVLIAEQCPRGSREPFGHGRRIAEGS